mmetsp:Transcript_73580/g.148188  ORF Transcript_73580/g.148188 Transcript_73580/m.148188 type:complete len:82 (+) Transcript_73580:226-471(+)
MPKINTGLTAHVPVPRLTTYRPRPVTGHTPPPPAVAAAAAAAAVKAAESKAEAAIDEKGAEGGIGGELRGTGPADPPLLGS